MRPNSSRTGSSPWCRPRLADVEGDAYVFAAVLCDPTLDALPNWLSQTFYVDPTAGDDAELRIEITERYHVDGQGGTIAFEDRFSASLSLDSPDPRPRVATVRRALDQWHRDNYGDCAGSDR